MKIDSSLMFDPVRVGAMAAQLEEVGFDGAYTFEGQSDPFISVAAAAMHTQKMELMTSIAVAFARNPMSLAYLGNDLQNLSGGRFILGLSGTGIGDDQGNFCGFQHGSRFIGYAIVRDDRVDP
mgnify:CR=1 FL=1